MPGHVFIVRGDLRKLACDAWLIPCSRQRPPAGRVVPAGRTTARARASRSPTAGRGSSRSWRPGPGRPRPWLARIGRSGRPVSWYADGAAEFLDAAAAAIAAAGDAAAVRPGPAAARPAGRRHRPRRGGREGRRGRPGAAPAAAGVRRPDFAGGEFDVALVCFDAATHAAAQAERARRADWPTDLTAGLRAEADRLAGHALRGELALFLGAGVSMAAGLPGWGGLLDELAARAGHVGRRAGGPGRAAQRPRPGDGRRAAAGRPRARRSAGRSPPCSARAGTTPWPTPCSPPCRSGRRSPPTTTGCSRTPGRLSDPDGLSVLPGAIRPDARRWLLKMHGCLSDPDRVVLTRASYTRYDERLPALGGMVQAFLVTRHVLFAGFSLTDDNFHRIVDAVRRLRGDGRPAGPVRDGPVARGRRAGRGAVGAGRAAGADGRPSRSRPPGSRPPRRPGGWRCSWTTWCRGPGTPPTCWSASGSTRC